MHTIKGLYFFCISILVLTACNQQDYFDVDDAIQKSWKLRNEERRDLLIQAIQECQKIGDTEGVAKATFFLGYYYESNSKLREADSTYVVLLNHARLQDYFEWEVGAIIQLANINTYRRRLVEADSLLYIALIRADEKGIPHLKGDIYVNQGVLYERMSDPNSAIASFNQALQVFQEGEDISKQIQTLNYLGIGYANLGLYDLSSEQYLKAGELALNHGDTSQYASAVYQSGINLNEIGQFRDALKLGKKALPLASGDSAKYARILNNIGVSYSGLFRETGEIEYYDSANLTIQRSLEIKKLINDVNGMAYNYFYLGNLYFASHNMQKARSNSIKAYNVWSERNDRENILKSAAQLADVYLEMESLDSAELFGHQVIELANDSKSRLKSLEVKAELEYKKGDLKEFAKTVMVRDSLNEQFQTSQRNAYAAAIQVRLNTNELEVEKGILIEQNRYQRTLVIGLASFLVLLIVFLTILFFQSRSLKKLNLTIASQNEKIKALSKQNYHFTKNSLAGIVGLINLQANKLPNGIVRQTLLSEKLRMETVNILYKMLFTGDIDTMQSINLKEILLTVTENTFDTLLPEDFLLTKEFELEDIEFQKERGLSIAMIVNELCINAYKHAFNERDRGKMIMRLKRNDMTLLLWLEDEGSESNVSGFELPKAESFGMQLINLMVQDLGAEMEWEDTFTGRKYKFEIPLI